MDSKSRILVLSSEGGHGQQSVATAVTDYLANDYDITVLNMTGDVMLAFDPLTYLHPKLNTEAVYNLLIKLGWYRLLNVFVGFGGVLFKYGLARLLTKRFVSLYQQYQPDIVVSLVPFYNRYANDAAQQCKLKFTIVTCDLDVRGYFHNIRTLADTPIYFIQPNHYTEQLIHKKQLNRYSYLGYPVKSSFLQQQPQSNNGLLSILIIMGGQGSRRILRYAKWFAKSPLPLTLTFCVGHNTKLKTILQTIDFPSQQNIHIQVYTNDIANLMAEHDVVLTKTGSCSIFEAVYSRRFILMDVAGGQLKWEKANVDYIEQMQLGKKIASKKILNKVLNELINIKDARPTKVILPEFLPLFSKAIQQELTNG